MFPKQVTHKMIKLEDGCGKNSKSGVIQESKHVRGVFACSYCWFSHRAVALVWLLC